MDSNFLNQGRALSTREQPSIGRLYKAMANPKHHVTFVVGAGLSIDSGFPTWSQLIYGIADEIPAMPNLDLGALIRSDGDDLMRKAENVLQMHLSNTGYGDVTDIVRRALYSGASKRTTPGPVVKSLTRLVELLRGRVSILTTNFDDVLDAAISSGSAGLTPKIFSMSQLSAWQSAQGDPDSVPILHLHGRIGRTKKDSKGALVLTESEFMKHGAVVRDALTQSLSSSVTVFLGLSITDPNLVGPLWDAKGKRSERYVVTVPEAGNGGQSVEAQRSYAVLKSDYISTVLKTTPIFLKSYTQLDQFIQECRLAISNPTDYFSRNASKSTAYGVRFSRILTDSYAKAGFDPKGVKRSTMGAPSLTDLLKGALATGDLADLLAEFRSDSEVKQRLLDLRTAFVKKLQPDTPEYFSLALWLRNPMAPKAAPYTLRLAGSSALTFEDPASMPFQSVKIEPHSDHVAARAVMRGKGQVWNLKNDEGFGAWRGVASSPLRYVDSVISPPINTTIGAINLQTTHMCALSQLKPDKFEEIDRISILSALDVEQRRRLFFTLESAAQALIQNSP